MDLEILRLEERVRLAIELGESHFREFKSAWEGPPGSKKRRAVKAISTDIGRTLVAFANADGGELLVGIEDDGEVTGLDLSDEQIGTLLDSPRNCCHQDTPLPPSRATKLAIDGKTIIYFSVSKGTNYVYLTADGRSLQRRDRESVPIAVEKIQFSRAETISREYDRAFVDKANIGDLDLELVGQVAEHVSKGMSVEKCLQHLELAEFAGDMLRLRRVAVLLFGKSPLRWHPRLQVRILRVDGTEIRTGDRYNVIKDEEVTDNILNLIESSWDLLRPHLTETRFSRDALFRTQIIYPELACREALVNAIAHRDYSNEGRGIEVRVFTDRMEIVSPGELLSSISLGDLQQRKGAHESRNTLVARVLRELGYMRELGEGIRRIYELMQSNDLTPPEFASGENTFTVTLSHRLIFTEEERIWLENFRDLDLTRDERTVVRLGYGDRLISPKDIWDSCGIVDTDYYRRLLESLREKGILEREIPRAAAYQKAAKRSVPKKAVPQFAIRVPGPKGASKPSPVGTSADISAPIVDDSEYAKVYVANLPFKFGEDELHSIFSQFGDVSSVNIPKNRYTANTRGYGFVEFDSTRSAKIAIAKSGQIVVQGRALTIREATGPRRSAPGLPEHEATAKDERSRVNRPADPRRVFIANLSPQSKQEELLKVLGRYGSILQLTIPVDPDTGQQRTYAFITFADAEAAHGAIADSGQMVLGGRVLYLQEYVDRSDSRT